MSCAYVETSAKRTPSKNETDWSGKKADVTRNLCLNQWKQHNGKSASEKARIAEDSALDEELMEEYDSYGDDGMYEGYGDDGMYEGYGADGMYEGYGDDGMYDEGYSAY